MSVTAAARSLLRSSASTARTTRLTSVPRPRTKSNGSPFSSPSKQTPPSPSVRIFRSPVELGSCVTTMLPYHTATAAALLNSNLSVSLRSYGWTAEDCIDDA